MDTLLAQLGWVESAPREQEKVKDGTRQNVELQKNGASGVRRIHPWTLPGVAKILFSLALITGCQAPFESEATGGYSPGRMCPCAPS